MTISIVTPCVLEVADRLEHVADELGVERARHLVEQHRPRPAGEGAGDRDPLLLAAGEQLGALVLAPLEAEAGEQLARLAIGLGPVEALGLGHAEGHVAQHAEVREQVVGLEDDAELGA